MKLTTLTDTASLAVLDVQCYVQWPHDTKAGPQVVRVPADDLLTVATDNGFQDWHTEYEFYSLGVESLVNHRGSSLTAVSKTHSSENVTTHSAGWLKRRIRRSSARSATPCERKLGYQEFREIALMFVVSNIEHQTTL